MNKQPWFMRQMMPALISQKQQEELDQKIEETREEIAAIIAQVEITSSNDIVLSSSLQRDATPPPEPLPKPDIPPPVPPVAAVAVPTTPILQRPASVTLTIDEELMHVTREHCLQRVDTDDIVQFEVASAQTDMRMNEILSKMDYKSIEQQVQTDLYMDDVFSKLNHEPVDRQTQTAAAKRVSVDMQTAPLQRLTQENETQTAVNRGYDAEMQTEQHPTRNIDTQTRSVAVTELTDLVEVEVQTHVYTRNQETDVEDIEANTSDASTQTHTDVQERETDVEGLEDPALVCSHSVRTVFER